jgi:hypothetical protein
MKTKLDFLMRQLSMLALHKLESLKFLLKAKKFLFRCQYNDESSLLQISLPRFFQANVKVDVHF